MTQDKRALVTGGTGHLGSMLCRALRERGIETTVLVRPSSSREALEGVDVSFVEGDVLDGASFARAARGCSVIFHAAAIFEIHARDEDLLHRVAVDGARNAVHAAAASSARLVFTSSVAAAGFGRGPGELVDETAWATDLSVPYYRAKQASERTAVETAAECGVDLVRVLPTLVLGPGDCRITPSSRFFLEMLTGKGATVPGGANVLDVRDAADAMIAAADAGRTGGRYILGGENALVRDLGAIAARLSGRTVPHLGLPRWAMTGIAAGMELASIVTGAPASLTRAAVRDVFGRYACYDTTRARTELGLTARPLETTLTDAARFFEARGLVALRAEAA
jgi:dihydroflavonol-4-reductase